MQGDKETQEEKDTGERERSWEKERWGERDGRKTWRERQREKKRERDVLFADSFLKWPQWPGLGWAKVGSFLLVSHIAAGLSSAAFLAHQQRAGYAVEQLRLEPAPLRDAITEGGGLTHYAIYSKV